MQNASKTLNEAMPEPVARAAAVMAAFDRPWFLCGGWSVDAWLGRTTREHQDIDVAVFQEDQAVLYALMADRIPVGHDDTVDDSTQEPWAGRWLQMPAHIHAKEPELEWDFQLCERDGTDLLLRRAPLHVLPLERATGMTDWGVPAFTPPAIVYYKAVAPTWRDSPRGEPRAHDIADCELLLPLLDQADRRWLAEGIGSVEPGHPWLPVLRGLRPAGAEPR